MWYPDISIPVSFPRQGVIPPCLGKHSQSPDIPWGGDAKEEERMFPMDLQEGKCHERLQHAV